MKFAHRLTDCEARTADVQPRRDALGIVRAAVEKAWVQSVSITEDIGEDAGGEFIRNVLNVLDEHQSRENAKLVYCAMCENLTRRGRRFSTGSIHDLLSSTTYCGTHYFSATAETRESRPGEVRVAGRVSCHACGSLFCSGVARPKGFEPLTPRFVVWCSIQLSYGR